MPVCLATHSSRHQGRADSRWPCPNSAAAIEEPSGRCIHIGLINNMADGALVATERQFLSLLDAASGELQVRLSLYALSGVSRSEAGARHIENFYAPAESLFGKRLDGLIVTGREPMALRLSDEPYWEGFTQVLEWARENTYSTVWSCLAAHAAVLHMDGIERVRSREKHYGIFECAQLAEHPLTVGTPARFALPHSRWNGLPEDALNRNGYRVLTRAADAGVDTFVKDQGSLFLFFQGHPEYESNTLLLEYRRDVGRFLRGESDSYPSMPKGYFNTATQSALTALRDAAVAQPGESLLADVSNVVEALQIENTWSATATCVYRNWLTYISARKQLDFGSDGGRHSRESLAPGASGQILSAPGLPQSSRTATVSNRV